MDRDKSLTTTTTTLSPPLAEASEEEGPEPRHNHSNQNPSSTHSDHDRPQTARIARKPRQFLAGAASVSEQKVTAASAEPHDPHPVSVSELLTRLKLSAPAPRPPISDIESISSSDLWGSGASDSSDSELEFPGQAHLPRPKRRFKPNLRVEVVLQKEYRKAAKTLQLAFSDDPYTTYLTKPAKDAETRTKIDTALYEAGVYSSIQAGVVLAIRDPQELEPGLANPDAPFWAVACFMDTTKPSSVWVDLFYDTKLKWLCNKRVYKRLYNEQLPLLGNARLEIMGDPEDRDEDTPKNWYLADLGTTAAARGKGCARQLLEHMYDHYIDPEEATCYLELSHPRNRPIYEKLGFTFVKTIYVGNPNCQHDDLRICTCEKTLTMDIMVRGVGGAKWFWDK